MKKKDIYLVVAAVFIKIVNRIPNLGSKTEAAKEIIGKLPSESKLTSKTLVNYFNYYILNIGKPQSPSNETLLILINYYSEHDFKTISEAIKYYRLNTLLQKEVLEKNTPYFGLKKSSPKESESKKSQKNKKQNSKNSTQPEEKIINQFYIVILAIVAISICSFYFFNKKGDINMDVGDVQIKKDFKQIVPTKETQFFSKENNLPLVWYANSNNKLEYFNSNGSHPSKKKLQPITREIIKKYFIEKLPLEKKNVDKNTTSIFNTSLKNNKKANSISIFIFDKHQKLENAFTNQLKKELTLKDYNATPVLIKPNKLNISIIENLQMHNMQYFKEDVKNYTSFICTGNVDFTFSSSKINTNLFSCKLQVSYTIISTKTNEVVETYSNLLIGNGFSKTTAKNNTIKKFKL